MSHTDGNDMRLDDSEAKSGSGTSPSNGSGSQDSIDSNTRASAVRLAYKFVPLPSGCSNCWGDLGEGCTDECRNSSARHSEKIDEAVKAILAWHNTQLKALQQNYHIQPKASAEPEQSGSHDSVTKESEGVTIRVGEAPAGEVMNDALGDILENHRMAVVESLFPNGGNFGFDESIDLKAKAALQDLFYNDVLAFIGEDEEPDTMKPKGMPVKGEKRQYEPAYSLRASLINQKLASIRAKAKAKFKGED